MKENSIEEDIKNAEHFIKSIKTDKEYKEVNGWHGYYNKEIFENCSNYVIPKQKVKDKIEEYKKMLLSCNRFSDVDRIKAINERILELQELLEGRK